MELKVIFFYSSVLLSSNFSTWLQELEPEILDYGVSKQTYSKTLSHLKDVNKKVLKLYNNQPEFKITFDNYYHSVAAPKVTDNHPVRYNFTWRTLK